MIIHIFASYSAFQLVETFNTLKQHSQSVAEYTDIFEDLMATVSESNPAFSEEWFVKSYVNGLRDGMKHQLRPLRPPTLTEACWMACDYEQCYPPKKSTSPNNTPYQKQYQYQQGKIQDIPPALPAKQQDTEPSAHINRARPPGICWRCGAKWQPGHKCQKVPLINMLQGEAEEQDDTDENPTEEMEQEQKTEDVQQHIMQISCQAVSGMPSASTPKIYITIGGKLAVALVDSGSTNTFMHSRFSSTTNCAMLSAPPITVRVAGGDLLCSDSVILNCPFTVENHEFTNNFRILNLPGQDVVIGCD